MRDSVMGGRQRHRDVSEGQKQKDTGMLENALWERHRKTWGCG